MMEVHLECLKVKEAIKQEFSIEEIHKNTGIDPWFLTEIQEIVNIEKESSSIDNLELLKKNGFSQVKIALLNNLYEDKVQQMRIDQGITPVYK